MLAFSDDEFEDVLKYMGGYGHGGGRIRPI